MTVIAIMAQALHAELFRRGYTTISSADCEAIMRAVIARGGEVADALTAAQRAPVASRK
jgi:hypothetical protein